MMINPLMLIFSERKSGVRNDLFLGEFIPRIQFLHNNSRIDSKNDLWMSRKEAALKLRHSTHAEYGVATPDQNIKLTLFRED